MLTPTTFCERIKKEAEGIEGVEVIVRDEGTFHTSLRRCSVLISTSSSLGEGKRHGALPSIS